MLTGTSRQKHFAESRLRMEKDMFELGRVKAAKRRRGEFMEKVMSAEAANNKAKEVEPISEDAKKILSSRRSLARMPATSPRSERREARKHPGAG